MAQIIKNSREYRIRYNREYFGYIVGYPEGDIILVNNSAAPLLERKASLEELQDYLLEELEVHDKFYLNTPPLVWLELTRRCNLNCPHCYIDGGLARQNEMKTHEFHTLIDELAQMGVWAVTFTGGEPTLHPDFVDLVVHAHECGMLIGIATNGWLLTEQLLNSLPQDGVIISVSLDNLHTIGNQQANNNFEIATRAILKSQEKGFLTNLMVNTNRRNIDDLEMWLDWGEKHGVSIRNIHTYPLGRGKIEKELELINTPEYVNKAAHLWLREILMEHEYHKKSGLCVGALFNYGLTLGYLTRRCSSGRFLCYISADGTVYPCTNCAAENILSPGNIRENGFINLWRSDWEIRNYSWDNFKSTCKGCVLEDTTKYYCSSRCPAMSYARHGNYFNCGSSEFDINSNIIRTELLKNSPRGKTL